MPRRSLMRFARVIPEHISVVRVQVCQSRQNWYRQHSDQWQSGSSRLKKATWLHGAVSHWLFWYQVQTVRDFRWRYAPSDSVSGEGLASQAEIEKTWKNKVKVRSCCAQVLPNVDFDITECETSKAAKMSLLPATHHSADLLLHTFRFQFQKESSSNVEVSKVWHNKRHLGNHA